MRVILGSSNDPNIIGFILLSDNGSTTSFQTFFGLFNHNETMKNIQYMCLFNKTPYSPSLELCNQSILRQSELEHLIVMSVATDVSEKPAAFIFILIDYDF
jgi:hypothetical protein